MDKEFILGKIKKDLKRFRDMINWVLFSLVAGVLIGLVAVAFGLSMDFVTKFRLAHKYMLYFLPVGAMGIVFFYRRILKEKDGGTNLVLSAIHSNDNIPLRMAPLIFVSTVLTHAVGGSAGREGAALQLGGSIGNALGKLFKRDDKDKHIMIMCGMSAAFSALFGAPLAAAIFSMEVISVGIMHYAALVPCVISALTAKSVAVYFGLTPVKFTVATIPAVGLLPCVEIGILGIACGLVSILFCVSNKGIATLASKYLKNPYLKAFIGGTLVLGLSLVFGDQRYNGTGTQIIASCFEDYANGYDFLLKILFTSITLACGYKGGEIVPTLFIGATFGAFAAGLFGLPVALFAACGMGALFCGVTNCPIASLLLCFEMFGFEGMPYYLIAIAFSYLASGYYGLYSSQKIVYSKYKSNYINKDVH